MSAWVMAVVSVAGLIIVIGGLFFLGMRYNWPPVVDAVRGLGKAGRRGQLKKSGRPGDHNSIVRHVGRSSGKVYDTPVVVEKTEDGLVVALPYGTRADWVKNVLAAGSAVVVTGGSTLVVDRPEVLPMEELLEYFPERDKRTFRRFDIDLGLRLRVTY